ncbi:GGDEF domain-containing protein [Actinoplanes sp. NPDC051859]|uniref:GGDEF domain-containing protein n=1 Tax=Actinoplanes sp. NPDC051859 TaxID=3363909 RepID=UPI00379742B7
MRQPVRLAELVPVVDRYRWMLACRVLVLTLLTGEALLRRPGTVALALSGAAVGWTLCTYALLPAIRRWRGAARFAFSVSLLGDGALLGAAWWLLGGTTFSVEVLVAAHVLGTTLLASFRTGAKVTLWHTVVALMLMQCAAAGLLGAPRPVDLGRIVAYDAVLWLICILTATFAAANERELRRRRYDSELLRQLSVALTPRQRPQEILRHLVGFARDELRADAVLVLAYPQTGPSDGFGVHWTADADNVLAALPAEAADSLVRSAAADSEPRLQRVLDPATDPVAAALLPGARNVVVLPFALDQVRGAVVVTRQSWSRRRGGARVERRLIATLHQATLQVAMALGRGLLDEQLRRAAETDGLTGVSNRATFEAAIAAAQGAPFSLALVDLDHFKKLNDTHGHQAGDQALQAAARALSDACQAGDEVFRYGGEEFAVLFAAAGRPEAAERAARLRAAVAASASPVPVTASIGVATCPVDATGRDDLLAAADAALYRAKEAGRNRVVSAGLGEPAAQAWQAVTG